MKLNKCINVNFLVKEDVAKIDALLLGNNITRSEQYFIKCLAENIADKRMTFVASFNGEFAGFCNLIFQSSYGFFKLNDIPELNDLIVLPKYRGKGIGRELIRVCEEHAKSKFTKIGLGVGLYKDYGYAHKLYFNLGYQPDGNGIICRNEPVLPGTQVLVDDDLLLYFWKYLENNTIREEN